jgi:hypothetical protein
VARLLELIVPAVADPVERALDAAPDRDAVILRGRHAQLRIGAFTATGAVAISRRGWPASFA